MECQLFKNGNPLILPFVQASDIDILIGKNLRRIRDAHSVSQEELAAKIGTPATRLSAYENGREGMGKDIMVRICNELKVEPWEFYIDEKSPIVKNEREYQKLTFFREEVELGIAEEIARYEEYQIDMASMRRGAVTGTREERLEHIGEVLGKYVPQSTMEKIVERMPQLAPILGKKKRERKKKAS